jgi:hypothetical protein
VLIAVGEESLGTFTGQPEAFASRLREVLDADVAKA